MVTIATNMAGRGTDIQLGGNKNFIDENITPEKTKLEKIKSEKLKKLRMLGDYILLEQRDMKVEELTTNYEVDLEDKVIQDHPYFI